MISKNDNPKLNKIIHDIRNMRQLTKEMIIQIQNMNDEEKMQIILTYNEVIISVNELLA